MNPLKEQFPDDPPTIDKMNRAGEKIAKAMSEAHGQIYQWGQTRELLYPSAGTSKDWIVQEHNVPLSWTWELRDDGKFKPVQASFWLVSATPVNHWRQMAYRAHFQRLSSAFKPIGFPGTWI